jgi:prepilin-type processing-associated H-X9-DG protein
LNAYAMSNALSLLAGKLYAFNDNVKIYHCPSDNSLDNSSPPQPRDRSYSISCGMNWMDDNKDTSPTNGSYFKTADIHADNQYQNPGPSQASVFVDVSANSIDNNEFPIFNTGEGNYTYYKLPTNRHSNGGTIGFADGHAEIWYWKFPYVTAGNAIPDNSGSTPGPGFQAPSSATDGDLTRLQQTSPHISSF